MYVDLLEHLSDVERRLGSSSKSYQSLSVAFKEHPNLRVHKDFDGIVRLCSADVNARADDIDIAHREEDGHLVVMPFVNLNGQRIYSDPPAHVVSSPHTNGFGEVPLPDWEDLLKEAGLGSTVISKVRWHLAAHRPVSYDQVEEENLSEAQDQG